MKSLKIKFIAVLAVAIMLLTAIVAQSALNVNSVPNKKLTIITTLFPQYDFTRQIAGDKADVQLLLTPGTESHLFDPTPMDMVNINNADMFIYTGDGMEPWAARILDGARNSKLYVVDASSGITLDEATHHDDEDGPEGVGEDAHEHDADPHIWVDPILACTMVDNIYKGLVEVDPTNKEFYFENAGAYKKQLIKLDEDIMAMVTSAKRHEIAFGGRFALYYFVKRYNLEYISPYDSCSVQSDPSVMDIALVIKEMTDKQLPVIYYEEFSTPKVAMSIAEQVDAELLLFHSGHNLSKEELDAGRTYIDVMRANLIALEKGLN